MGDISEHRESFSCFDMRFSRRSIDYDKRVSVPAGLSALLIAGYDRIVVCSLNPGSIDGRVR